MYNFKFPVYKLRSHISYKEIDNISYVQNTIGNWQILDNKNLSGSTLAQRRFNIKGDKYKLDKSIFTFAQLLKGHRSKDRYIDTTGKCFIYNKTIRAKLIYRAILEFNYINNFGISLTIDGINIPIPVPAGTYDVGFVGLLEINGAYILYELTKDRKPDTWRLV